MTDTTETGDATDPTDTSNATDTAVTGNVVAITGAGSGIGRAMARLFARSGVQALALSDVMPGPVQELADELAAAHGIDVTATTTDVSDEVQVASFIDRAEADHGPIDLFCGNAGIFVFGGPEVPTRDWERIMGVNVMAHVHASRILVPRMIARGGGTLLLTVSAAGLLTQIGSAPYSVTKHAALGLADWLSITYGDQGLKVFALCPQAVATGMTAGIDGGGVAGVDGMLSAEAVADAALAGLAAGDMLILPHVEVAEYARRRAADHERWLRGMRRLQSAFADFVPPVPPPT